jgi:hypothetical protein
MSNAEGGAGPRQKSLSAQAADRQAKRNFAKPLDLTVRPPIQAKWPATGKPIRASSVALFLNEKGNVELCFHSPDDTLFAVGEVLGVELPNMIGALLEIEAKLSMLSQPEGTA